MPRHPEQKERAQELAIAYRLRNALDVWLRDPRLKAELAEARATEGETRPQTAAQKALPTSSAKKT